MNEQIDQAIANFQTAIILAEGNMHRGSATFDETLEIESAAAAKLKSSIDQLTILRTKVTNVGYTSTSFIGKGE